MKLPTLWATNANYAAGPDTGSETKTDPASAGDGFIRGVAAAPQHVNYLLNAQCGASRRALTVAMLRLREATLSGTTIDDTAESCAGISLGQGRETLLLKVNSTGVLKLGDTDRLRLGGALTSVSSLVTSAATDGSRIVVIGTGGNRNCFSDGNGAAWTAGGALGSGFDVIVWEAVSGLFVSVNSGANTSRTSPDATAWSAGGAPGDNSEGGLACLSSGRLIACGFNSDAKTRISDDGATTWGAGGTIAGMNASGWICGNGGSCVYHYGSVSPGNSTNRVSVSTDGVNWATVVDFTAPALQTYSGIPRTRIEMCQNTGLLVAMSVLSGGATELRASLDGSVWTEPMYVGDAPLASFAVAGGKLLHTRDAAVFQSDGVGFE